MAKIEFRVVCAWDEESRVWYVDQSNVPGLSAEAGTLPEMEALLIDLVPQLAMLNSPDDCHGNQGRPMSLHTEYQRTHALRC